MSGHGPDTPRAGDAISFERVAIGTARGASSAIVASPKGPIRIGRARLLELRASARHVAVDRQFVAAADRLPGARVLVFRGRSADGAGTWAFEDGLSDAEAKELGGLLVRAQVPTCRELCRRGIVAFLQCDLGFREVDALRSGTDRARAEVLKRTAMTVGARAEIDLDSWILRHLTFFFSTTYERFMAETLPGLVPMLEQRAQHLGDLIRKIDTDRA